MATLFPDWPPSHGLVGIARLAADAPLIEAKRRVDYHELPTRKFITRCNSTRVPFRFTINPYRGCEFGCKYCYARYTHEFMELREPEDFETHIFAKQWSAGAFLRELRKVPPGEHIAIGTATDPYQPAERRYGITRKILEAIAADRGRREIWIVTKSDLVARDADLLARIRERNRVGVNMTITTVDEPLARLLEPYAPRPSLRLEALRTLVRAGISCGVLCCPLMPLINDSERSIDAVAKAAAGAGATSLHGNPLFLKPCSKQVFLSFVEARFPQLAARYRARFEESAFIRGAYPDVVAARVQAARERYGLRRRQAEYQPEWLDEQLGLFDPDQSNSRDFMR